MNKPQTIQIFLPDGNPRSVRIAQLTNRLVEAILMPRSKLEYVNTRPEVKNVGIYFLFGDSIDKLKPPVYIGEAENVYTRLLEHHKDPDKDFWQYAIVFIAKPFTKTHVKFLEHLAIQTALENNHYSLINKSKPKRPFVTESMEADLMDNFETIGVLISTLGFPIFDRVNKKQIKPKDLLFIHFQGVKAEGDYIEDGFIVFKGSEARKAVAASFRLTQVELRKKLLNEGILVEKKDKLVFLQNYIFTSPSAASDIIRGSSSNGWIEWKNKEGKTLDELKRR